MIPWNAIVTKYAEIADQLITVINASVITVHFAPQTTLSPLSVEFSDRPSVIDQYGGRLPIAALPNRIDESGSNLNEVPNTENISGRTYWITSQSSKNKPGVSFTLYDQKLKLITYTSDTEKLNNASKIEYSGILLKNVELPKPYGFSKRYSVSYWESINA